MSSLNKLYEFKLLLSCNNNSFKTFKKLLGWHISAQNACFWLNTYWSVWIWNAAHLELYIPYSLLDWLNGNNIKTILHGSRRVSFTIKSLPYMLWTTGDLREPYKYVTKCIIVIVPTLNIIIVNQRARTIARQRGLNSWRRGRTMVTFPLIQKHFCENLTVNNK